MKKKYFWVNLIAAFTIAIGGMGLANTTAFAVPDCPECHSGNGQWSCYCCASTSCWASETDCGCGGE